MICEVVEPGTVTETWPCELTVRPDEFCGRVTNGVPVAVDVATA